MRLGILGGSFNPPHIAHLACAQEAALALRLDRVLLIPVARAPHKPAAEDPGAKHRLAMCEAAVSGDPRLGVSDLEIERGGDSYTVDTLRWLHARTPADELTLIVGADLAVNLSTWREAEAILELAGLAVAQRAQSDPRRIEAALAPLRGRPAAAPSATRGGVKDRVRYFEMPRLDVSSTMVRERVGQDQPIRYLVPEGVRVYIATHGLYRTPPAADSSRGRAGAPAEPAARGVGGRGAAARGVRRA